MRLSWYSNAPWAPTGYGSQTKLFVPRIKADGHDIAILANYGLAAQATTWHEIPVLPQGYGGHSEDILLAHHAAWLGKEPGWLVTLYDVWALGKIPYIDNFRIASWVPIDHIPVPPEVRSWFREDRYAIAMSKFGQAELVRSGVNARYVPHGIDTGVFKPTPSDMRARLKIPDNAFLITINAANKGGTPVRKAWSEMLSAATLFMDRHEDAYLYLHTNVKGIANGPALDIMLEAIGIPKDRLRIVDQYPYLSGQINDGLLAELYSASDVLLASSMGEGFGIPVIEAQACGTPVIVTDFSAQAELCGAGWKIGYQPWFDHFQGAFLATPLIGEILNALEAAYASKDDKALRTQAVEFARQYDVDQVYRTYWKPVLAELEAKLAPPKITRQQRRAKKRRKAA